MIKVTCMMVWTYVVKIETYTSKKILNNYIMKKRKIDTLLKTNRKSL